MKKIIIALSMLNINIALAADFEFRGIAEGIYSPCVHGNDCNVRCKHHAWIDNATSQTKMFYVRYKVCANSNDCNQDRYKILVKHGIWNDGKNMSVTTKYSYAGSRYYNCYTEILDDKLKVLKTFQGQGKVEIQ